MTDRCFTAFTALTAGCFILVVLAPGTSAAQAFFPRDTPKFPQARTWLQQKAKLPPSDNIPADFFHDVRIRQAFDYAFDYDTMVQSGLEGFGANPTYLPPGVLGWSEDAPKYKQDLPQAEKLFKETGYWDKGFEVSILVEEDNPTFTPVGLILKDSLEKLNPKFRVNVVQVAESQFDEISARLLASLADVAVKSGQPLEAASRRSAEMVEQPRLLLRAQAVLHVPVLEDVGKGAAAPVLPRHVRDDLLLGGTTAGIARASRDADDRVAAFLLAALR